jgi:nucleoid DNA-binding protein
MAKKNAAPTKSQIVSAVAGQTDLSKKQVSAVLEALGGQMKKALKGVGVFTLPGVCKMRVVKKAATKAREGVNPFTGEKMQIKAKPASKKVRIRALKNLNEMVGWKPGPSVFKFEIRRGGWSAPFVFQGF